MTQLSHSLAAYQAIRKRILALDGELDEETLTDTLEGLTDLHDVVAAIIRSAVSNEALAAGLKGHIDTLQERLRRLWERASKQREIARDAMIEAEIRTSSAPDFTISVRPGSPSVTVVDEAAVPGDYWRPSAPRLDRASLLSDLKRGVTVAGAVLSNAQPVITVRIR